MEIPEKIRQQQQKRLSINLGGCGRGAYQGKRWKKTTFETVVD
jgi:hypothetical protein